VIVHKFTTLCNYSLHSGYECTIQILGFALYQCFDSFSCAVLHGYELKKIHKIPIIFNGERIMMMFMCKMIVEEHFSY
jgi:hypothetical protein